MSQTSTFKKNLTARHQDGGTTTSSQAPAAFGRSENSTLQKKTQNLHFSAFSLLTCEMVSRRNSFINNGASK